MEVGQRDGGAVLSQPGARVGGTPTHHQWLVPMLTRLTTARLAPAAPRQQSLRNRTTDVLLDWVLDYQTDESRRSLLAM